LFLTRIVTGYLCGINRAIGNIF
jgi:MFS family permease